MSRQLFHTVSLIAFLCSVIGCSASTIQNTPVSTGNVKVTDEPCWVKSPNCKADAASTTLYFVGQSKEPKPSWGRPLRESFHSAQRDAEQEYGRFLGVDIETSSYLQSIFKDEQYRMQFEETIKESVSHTVSALIKADDYFVSHEQTSEGEPLWSVYVLLKISKADVRKHQEAIAQEARQLALAPKPPDEWVATVFNIDDTADVYVNGKKINQCDFSRTCEIKLSSHFKVGRNKVRIDYINHVMFWTYGYEVTKNGEVMYEGRCGQVWVLGCGFLNTKKGLVHTFEFEVEKDEPLNAIGPEQLHLEP
ncbi:MAG: hypothetical protein HOK97_23580 [Deltaproteobacteria bacterium]|nr:hypothetical protein [Deltaproteobacteria bacterium]